MIYTQKYFLLLLLGSLLLFGCKPKYYQGEAIYQQKCANCHGENGLGLRNLYPPINGSDYLINNSDELPCIIRYGISDTIVVNGKTYTTPMAGINELSDIDVTNLVNFIESTFLKNPSNRSLKDINMKLESCK